jgi:hypothetical protein
MGLVDFVEEDGGKPGWDLRQSHLQGEQQLSA